MKFKYVIKNAAWEAGKTVTFMPKPIFGDNGSGMHCHQSLWKDGEPLFYDETGYGGLSDMARWYIGGLLKHAPSLLAFTNPTVNSYHRLVPGYEAPVNLVYSQRNRSACIRIPITGIEPEGQAHRVPRARPVEQPVPRLLGDAHGRPRRHQEQDRAAATPVDKDLYELPPDEAADDPAGPRLARRRCSTRSRPTTTTSLEGGVFTAGPDRDLDRLQARERDRPDPAAPAPARVRALLRHLIVHGAERRNGNCRNTSAKPGPDHGPGLAHVWHRRDGLRRPPHTHRAER